MTTQDRPKLGPEYHTVTPHLVIKDAASAIEFYKRVFGATEKMRFVDPKMGGKIVCAELIIGSSLVAVADDSEEWKSFDPRALGGSPVTFELHVDDVDAVTARAIEAGAKVIYPVKDQFYGERSGRVEDPFGHQWIISTHIEDVSVEEMGVRMARWWEEYEKEKAEKNG
jgi:PhnB protein